MRACRSSLSPVAIYTGDRIRYLDAHTSTMIYVLTGTSRGIGLELVKQLVARGDHVVATARKPDDAAELQELAKAHKDAITIVQMDVQDPESVKARSAPSVPLSRCHKSLLLCVCAVAFKGLVSNAQAAAKAIGDKHPGGVDVLINDAGINSPFQRACEQYATFPSS